MNVHAPVVTSRSFSATRSRLRTLSLADAASAATFSVVVSLALRPVADPDSFWHLATGRWIWRNRTIPTTDPFSWTAPGRSWVAHEWLTEAIWYPVHRLSGWTGLVLLSALVILLALICVWRTARVLGGSPIAASGLVLLASLASLHTWGVRPQMITFALMATVTLWTVKAWTIRLDEAPEQARKARRRLWWVPAMMVPWANAHGGYIFGIALLGSFATGITVEHVLSQRFDRYRLQRACANGATDYALLRTSWLVLLATTAATLINPHGIGGLIYPFTYLGDNASTRYVAEWFAPDFSNPQFWPFAGFLLLGALTLVRLRHRLPLFAFFQLSAFAFLAVQSVRNITQFVATAVPWIALALRRNPRPVASDQGKPLPSGAQIVHLLVSVGAIVSLAGLALPQAGAQRIERSHQAIFPTEAVAWMQNNPSPKVLNQYDWGGYLTWHAEDIPVAVDGRPDMYGDAFMDRHISIWHARKGWKDRLDADGYNRVFGAPTQPIVKKLRATPGWKVVFEDDLAVVFDRAS